MRLIKLFIITVFVLGNNVLAQNIIRGIVYNENKIPLEGANVFIPMLVKGTSTNSSGEFELTGLPNGKFDIQISHIGYASQIVPVTLGKTQFELDVVLIPASVEAERVVVSTGYSTTQHQNAVKIEVLRLNEHHLIKSPNFIIRLLVQKPSAFYQLSPNQSM